jgi:signal transduction histidine kinase
VNIARWSPLNRRALAELAYVMAAWPIAVVGFFYAFLTTTAGFLLSLITLGVPVLILALMGARLLGAVHLRLAARLLGVVVTTPERETSRRPGVIGWVGWNLRDLAAWRVLVYLFLKGPLGVVEAMVVVFTWVYGLAYLGYPLWRPMVELSETDGAMLIGDTNSPFFGPARPFLNAMLGIVLLLAVPWAVRLLLLLDMALLRSLLGPTASSRRIRHLEETRAHAVEDSAERLRRIERDLHDGAQVRLVTLAMHLGAAKEQLAGQKGVDPAVNGLIAGAHQNAKDALVELRSLVRGIHPPILDNGLDAALATLAASSSVPVRLRVAVPRRPMPAIESIAYFCTAELLANVAKHSRARQATVTVAEQDGLLRVTVHDDGIGGCGLRENGGLAGLAERLATVDGRLTVDSPDGGPTVVTVDLPFHV